MAEMNGMKFALIIVVIVSSLAAPSLALSDYQKGVLDGLSKGWSMAQKYDTATGGDISPFNSAVTEYNSWIESIFGVNDSLMLKPFPESTKLDPYSVSKSYSPVHAIDASWNQSQSLLPEADAYGMVGGYPAETYYSIGPALANF
jgi:hypothetical protein